MIQPLTSLKAQAAAQAIKMIIGIEPEIIERPGGIALVRYKPADIPQVVKSLEMIALKSYKAPAGDIAIDFSPILWRLGLKYLAPGVLFLFVLGFIAGMAFNER